MGERGPIGSGKDPRYGAAARGYQSVSLDLPSTDEVEQLVPNLPDRPGGEPWREEVQAAWLLLWSGPVSPAYGWQDLPALYRLAGLYQEYLDAWQQFVDEGEERLVPTRQGVTLNPLLRYHSDLERRMAGLEKELGVTPMARARLGLKAAQGALAKRKVDASGNEESPPSGEDGDVIDAEGWEEPD